MFQTLICWHHKFKWILMFIGAKQNKKKERKKERKQERKQKEKNTHEDIFRIKGMESR